MHVGGSAPAVSAIEIYATKYALSMHIKRCGDLTRPGFLNVPAHASEACALSLWLRTNTEGL